MSSRRAPFLCALLLSLWSHHALAEPPRSVASPAPFPDSQRLRVVVWGRSSNDGAFLERLRGQTVDLPVDLVNVDAAPFGADVGNGAGAALDRQVEQAHGLALAQSARVVAWRTNDDVLLLLATPAPARLLVRRIAAGDAADSSPHRAAPTVSMARPAARARAGEGGAGGASVPPPRSASLESAALIIRAALMAVLDGGTFGVPRETGAATATIAVAPPTRVVAVVDAEPSPWSGFLLGDLRIASDGAGNSAPKGFGAHLGARWRRLVAGATAMTTLDRDVGTVIAQPFWRQNLAGFVGMELVVAGRAHLTAEAQGGVAFFNLYRSAGTVHRPHLLLGAEIRGSFDVMSRGRFSLSLWAGTGADYIPHAPPLTLDGGPTLWAARRFQPRLMVGTGLAF